MNEEPNPADQLLTETFNSSEARVHALEAVLANTGVVAVHLDARLNIRNFTPNAKQLFPAIGMWIGKPVKELCSTVVDLHLSKDVDASLRDNSPISQQLQAQDGRWYLRRLYSQQLPGCQIEEIVVTYTDISELKQAQNELADRESKMRLMADAIPALVAYVDRQERYRFVNKRYRDWFGLERTDVLGKTVREVIGDAGYEAIESKLRAALSGETVSWETHIKYQHGPERYVQLDYVPDLTAEGTVLGFYALIQDVTERHQAESAIKRSEEEFRMVFELSGSAKLIADPRTGRFLRVNRRWCQITGREEAELLQMSLADVFDEADFQRIIAHAENAVEQEGLHWEVEVTIQKTTAQPVCLMLNATLMDWQNRERKVIVATVQDITDRIALENVLREADRRKDEFLAMLAHELRNPLAPIRSGIDLLAIQRTYSADIVEVMREQTAHLVRLVDDLLDVSRIMRGKIRLNPQTVNVVEVLERLQQARQGVLDAKGQRLVFKFEQPSMLVKGDSVRLYQIFDNLVTNASKYGRFGDQIEISVHHRASEVVAEVIDHGVGIDRDFLPKIFDIFTQSERSLDRSEGGLGIGLTLVRSLIALHAGGIEVESGGIGQGSTFRVRLPAQIGADETKPLPETVVALSKFPPSRILVVDDNRSARFVLTRLLQALGPHEVQVAEDGETAIAVAKEFCPHVVLLDIGLPGIDGFEVASRLRRSGQVDCLIVALTGYGKEEDRKKSELAGFDMHFAKPASVDQLRSILAASANQRPH